ncbi:MAG: type II toxin-antitoxin system RelE/ParE family toxin [Oscillospiraceae bacterium]|jgi:plasmid stabilization system protein ParE|nr:type II toxin-antitoxin system RelE/ParE family toxin [Oscillospiraceae bacterium]
MDKEYTLSYLPIFEEDIVKVRDYISFDLANPVASARLIEDVEDAIHKRLSNPEGFKPYKSKRDRKQPYYRINVKNYAVFYVVIDNVMEVRRFVYAKRNIPEII